jgi:peptidyl-prolyl cis-trans isomerase D
VLEAVLRADASKLPAIVGVDLGAQGYVVARVNQVLGRDPVAADPKQARTLYARALAEVEAQAYVTALSERYKVEVNPPRDAASAPSQ